MAGAYSSFAFTNKLWLQTHRNPFRIQASSSGSGVEGNVLGSFRKAISQRVLWHLQLLLHPAVSCTLKLVPQENGKLRFSFCVSAKEVPIFNFWVLKGRVDLIRNHWNRFCHWSHTLSVWNLQRLSPSELQYSQLYKKLPCELTHKSGSVYCRVLVLPNDPI